MAMSIFEALRHAIDLRLAEVAALPQGVQTWMVIMRTLFLSSILFVYWKKEARIVLLMAVLTAVLLFGFKTALPEIHSGNIGQIIHVFVWTATLVFLITRRGQILNELRAGKVSSMIYGVWVIAVALALSVSLFFDFSALFARFFG